MPLITEARNRGAGEGLVERIEVLGTSFEEFKEEIRHALKSPKKMNRLA